MANLKSITELPVAESAEGLNLIVNDNGAAKQIAASAVGAQADWTETDENSPAFVKNKPIEEWDIDIDIESIYDETEDDMRTTYTVNYMNTFENIKNKILHGIQPKCKLKVTTTNRGNTDTSYMLTESFNNVFASYSPHSDNEEMSPEHIQFGTWGVKCSPMFVLLADNTIDFITAHA